MSLDAVLALRPLGLGDLLTAVPALRGLRRGFPNLRVVLACDPALEPLARCNGAVDGVLPAEPLRPLRTRRPAVAVDLHGKGPASQRILLATEPVRLIAFANPAVPETEGMPRWRDGEHEVHRWCRLLVQSGLPADPGDLHLEVPRLPVAAAHAGSVVIHPGAASHSRRWPPERFASVARHLLRAGARVILTGSASDVQAASRIASMAPGVESLAGRTSLLELASVVQEARLVICGDTGCGHLATATRTPSVLLFGPTPPAVWGPPPNPRHRVLWAGRRGDPHGAAPDPGLLAIEVAAVTGAVDAQLRAAVA